jgi:hypothetical protein
MWEFGGGAVAHEELAGATERVGSTVGGKGGKGYPKLQIPAG